MSYQFETFELGKSKTPEPGKITLRGTPMNIAEAVYNKIDQECGERYLQTSQSNTKLSSPKQTLSPARKSYIEEFGSSQFGQRVIIPKIKRQFKRTPRLARCKALDGIITACNFHGKNDNSSVSLTKSMRKDIRRSNQFIKSIQLMDIPNMPTQSTIPTKTSHNFSPIKRPLHRFSANSPAPKTKLLDIP